MTNSEIILHCLKEDTDVTCRKSPCDKPEQEGNTGECCDKCALGILEEYEIEVRSKTIDEFKYACFQKIKNEQNTKYRYLDGMDIFEIAQKLKEGVNNEDIFERKQPI